MLGLVVIIEMPRQIRDQKTDQWLSSCPGPEGGKDWQAASYHQPTDTIILPLHNTHLNEVASLKPLNPTTENVALYIGRALKLPGEVRLMSVEVWETPENSAVFCP